MAPAVAEEQACPYNYRPGGRAHSQVGLTSRSAVDSERHPGRPTPSPRPGCRGSLREEVNPPVVRTLTVGPGGEGSPACPSGANLIAADAGTSPTTQGAASRSSSKRDQNGIANRDHRPRHDPSVRDIVPTPRTLTIIPSRGYAGVGQARDVDGDVHGADAELAASSAAQRSSSSWVNARRTQNSLPSGSAMTTKLWSGR